MYTICGWFIKHFFCKIVNNPRAREKRKRIYSPVSLQAHPDIIPVTPLWAERGARVVQGKGCLNLQVARRGAYASCYWLKCSDLVELVRMTSSLYISRQPCSWEPGCYSPAIVHFHISFIIEVREDHFLPITGGGCIRSPVAYQSSPIVAA